MQEREAREGEKQKRGREEVGHCEGERERRERGVRERVHQRGTEGRARRKRERERVRARESEAHQGGVVDPLHVHLHLAEQWRRLEPLPRLAAIARACVCVCARVRVCMRACARVRSFAWNSGVATNFSCVSLRCVHAYARARLCVCVCVFVCRRTCARACACWWETEMGARPYLPLTWRGQTAP